MQNIIDFFIKRNMKLIVNNFVKVFSIYGISTRIIDFNNSYRIRVNFISNRDNKECDSIEIYSKWGMIYVDFQWDNYWIMYSFIGLIYSKKWILNKFKELQILTKDEMIIKDIIE